MTPHRSPFSQHPLAQLAVAFSAGICAANYLPTRFSLFAGVVCSIGSLVLLVKKKTAMAGVGLLVAMFFVGQVLTVLERRSEGLSDVRRLLDDNPEKTWLLTGVLDGPPEFARDRVFLSLRVEKISDLNASGRVWLLLPFRAVRSSLWLTDSSGGQS